MFAVPVVGVAGAAIHRYDVQNRNLEDLSVIGQGQPVVVQIHDPGCALCRRLMANTRQALDGKDHVLYRVADIKSSDGAAFQRKHNVPHVTLLLFNGKGRHIDTIQGVTPVDELEARFAQLAPT